MKKVFAFAVLAAVLAAMPVFAQEEWKEWNGNRRSTITLDPVPLIIGAVLGGFGIDIGYEYAPHPQFSGKANIFYIGFDPLKLAGYVEDTENGGTVKSNASLFRANMEGRWYPSGSYLRGWFFNAGLQYHWMGASASVLYNGGYVKEGQGFNTFGGYLGVGYKAVFGKDRGGFVIEPFLDYIQPFYTDIPSTDSGFGDYMIGALLGVRGFRLGVSFGAAF